MGAIARNIANKITTSGVFTSGAITNASVTGITVLANASDGITFISSQTANNSASISFTSGLDSTYKAYKFVFVNMHPRTNDAELTFNMSTDSGSNYNVNKTTSMFRALHNENDSSANLAYETSHDFQGTGFADLTINQGNGADESSSGTMTLFNPASTTYVKHFINRFCQIEDSDRQFDNLSAGYGNTTSAVNAIQFKMNTGNIDGTIYLYGIK